MAESKEELNSLLMKLKQESEKAGLKLNSMGPDAMILFGNRDFADDDINLQTVENF